MVTLNGSKLIGLMWLIPDSVSTYVHCTCKPSGAEVAQLLDCGGVKITYTAMGPCYHLYVLVCAALHTTDQDKTWGRSRWGRPPTKVM